MNNFEENIPESKTEMDVDNIPTGVSMGKRFLHGE